MKYLKDIFGRAVEIEKDKFKLVVDGLPILLFILVAVGIYLIAGPSIERYFRQRRKKEVKNE